MVQDGALQLILRNCTVSPLRDFCRGPWEQGIRQALPPGVKRHEWKGAHGYRKAFKSRAEQVMRPANVEILMGHDIGVSESYWRPTEHELLDDYVKAVPLLSILGNNTVPEKQIEDWLGLVVEWDI